MNELMETIQKYPNLLSVKDLVDLGIFSSNDYAYESRVKGNSPDYIKVGHKILFPRESVIQFLKNRFKKGDKSSSNEVASNEPTAT